MTGKQRLWCLLPAAGIGQRMGAGYPKQYLPLQHKTLLEVTLTRLHQSFPDATLVLPLHPQDRWWPTVASNLQQAFPALQLITVTGGAERADSVLQGLLALQDQAAEQDWVLVHDVARPCVRDSDLQRLWQELQDHPIGGLLAAPVADTMKRGDATNAVVATVDRKHLWHALTPQMFRYGLLKKALVQALEQGLPITDEASALEAAGYQPLLIEGRRDNLKVTRPEDLPLAEYLLSLPQE